MYRFTPILKTLVWGTENWVLSGVPGNETVVAEGPDAGKTINEIYGGEFPLLIKFIDARQDLSIQVHPDDELAAKRHNCKGKTEMWYVIGTSEGAHLLSGLKEKITPEDYVRLVGENKITDVLANYEVNPGDVFFLPAGRIHAIGGGCYLAEIQQTSNITYRIYDYGRLGLDGKPRELHTELAKDAIDYSVIPDYRTAYESRKDEENEIVKCPFFTTSLFEIDKPVTRELLPEEKFMVLIALEGEGEINGMPLKAGEALLAPASEGSVTMTPAPESSMKILASHI